MSIETLLPPRALEIARRAEEAERASLDGFAEFLEGRGKMANETAASGFNRSMAVGRERQIKRDKKKDGCSAEKKADA